MPRTTDPRKILLAAGTAAFALASQPAAAQPPSAQGSDAGGTVIYEGGAAIPKGEVEIYVEDPSAKRTRDRAADLRVTSDGGSNTITFALPSELAAAPGRQIVARLKRADGWLLARGSADFEPGTPVEITLYTVIY